MTTESTPRQATAKPPKHMNVGAATVALVAALKEHRTGAAQRAADVLARALERDGDANAAAKIRAAVSTTGPEYKEGPSNSDGMSLVTWFPPTDLSGELVLDAVAGARLERLAVELSHAPKFLASGLDAPTRVLFHGPSGTGKTLAARWLGGRLGLPVAVASLHALVDSFLGATAKNLAKCFESVRSGPCVIFLDEVDGLCSRRDATCMDMGEVQRVTSSMLQQLDALPPETIVVAATNFVQKIDPAFRRRLATEIEFGLPDREARETMLRRWWAKLRFFDRAVDVESAVAASEGLTGAALRAAAMAAGRDAVLRDRPLVWLEIEHVFRAAIASPGDVA